MLTKQKTINNTQYTVVVDASENLLEVIKEKNKLAPAVIFQDNAFELEINGETSILTRIPHTEKYKIGSIYIQQVQAEQNILDTVFAKIEALEAAKKKRSAKSARSGAKSIGEIMGSSKYKKVGTCNVDGDARSIQLKVDESHPNYYKCILRGTKQLTLGVQFPRGMIASEFKKTVIDYFKLRKISFDFSI